MSPRKSTERDLANKLKVAFEMFDLGITMMRQSLRRRNPRATKRQIDDLLAEWLASRPLGVPGRHVAWPRPSLPRPRRRSSGRSRTSRKLAGRGTEIDAFAQDF